MPETTQHNFQAGLQITQDQTEFFQQNGYLHFKQFLPRETVQHFLQELNNIQQLLLEKGIDTVNGIPLKFGRDGNGDTFIQRFAFASHYSKLFRDFLKDPRLQPLLQPLQPYEGRIGENEKDGLVVNHYINTPDSAYKQLGWHTDSPRDLFLGSRIMPMLNVGLHLDDYPKEKGGLRILPGTHNQGIFSLLFKKKYFIDNRPDPKEIGFDIEAGDLTVHDGRLWHRVQQSPYYGEQSRRRVMYIPFVTGAYAPKKADSPTPLYHKIGKVLLKAKKGHSHRPQGNPQPVLATEKTY
ncbi:phytanoyl-CoA dioxygenase family protein [Foetidibacter luteolus]|uniref:phytanoyl-CoA dioxygenase family protein n=1 Tax=Foetidibacter luteolus TaxID=2608880 RepID=UPI00129B2A9C|nr:phytanoyl-CoA dioxygenase family protein [Foetidibacter luteolus]